jgi:hypothetical protein
MSWRGILAAVLIVCAIIGARQFSTAQQDTHSKAQQDTYSKAQQDTSSKEEVEICRGKNSFTYEADGKRYSLPFEVIDDQAVVEGDIVFGQATDVLNGGANYVVPVVPDYVRGAPKRWESNLLPYIIDASVTASDRAVIQQAIMAWQRATNVRFRQLSGARDWKLENYVKFSGQKNQCSSNSLGIKQRLSGKVNEQDSINVVEVAGCGQNWGRIAHEIGHVLGLGHEHSRGGRDDYITILWSNIDGPKQFCRVIWDQQALANTAYDYDSIMHYASTQAAKRSSDCKKVTYDGKQDCLAFLPNQEKLEQQRQTGRLPNHVLTAPDVARTDGAPVASVVLMRVLPSGSVGRDPTDGADLDGAAPAHGVTAMAGSRMAGRARHSTTGTTTGGRRELATPLSEACGI